MQGDFINHSSGVINGRLGLGQLTGNFINDGIIKRTINQKNAQITGSIINNGIMEEINLNSSKITDSIINTGTINKEITIESTSQIGGSILNSGTINSIISTSNYDLTINNNDTINSGITNAGSGTITLNNQGYIEKDSSGNNLTNSDIAGKIRVSDYLIHSKQDSTIDKIQLGGSNTNGISFDKITLNQSNLNIDKITHIQDIIQGANNDNIGSIIGNGSGDINFDYDKNTGNIKVNINLKKSSQGALFRANHSLLNSKTSFINATMSNAMNATLMQNSHSLASLDGKNNLYASANQLLQSDISTYTKDYTHSFFILPYFSSTSIDLEQGKDDTAHTQGILVGASTLEESGLWGIYAGYEDNDIDSDFYGLDNRSYYVGLKYYNDIYTLENLNEVYVKANTQFGLLKNDLSKRLIDTTGIKTSKAEPNTYSYSAGADMGINFYKQSHIISPEIGIAYEGSHTQEFDMIGDATIAGGEKTYANDTHIFSLRTNISWYKDWHEKLKTLLQAGVKYNLNPNIELHSKIGADELKDDYAIARVEGNLNASMIVPLEDNFYFTLSYGENFNKDRNTHMAYSQVGYKW